MTYLERIKNYINDAKMRSNNEAVLKAYDNSICIIEKVFNDRSSSVKLKELFPDMYFSIIVREETGEILVSMRGLEIVKDGFLSGDYGTGLTFEEACSDYLKIIDNNTLRYYKSDKAFNIVLSGLKKVYVYEV